MKRPELIARQGGKPSGLLGRIVATAMQRETLGINRHVVAMLNINPGDRVLDIGCGNGSSLRLLAERTGDGLAIGVDYSPLMCRRARSINEALIASNHVQVRCARSDDLPFDTGFFDAAMSIHTLYFWDPAEPHLLEIARVLRPGGQIVLAFRTDDDPHTADFPASVYTFRSVEAVTDLVVKNGFESVECERLGKCHDGIVILRATRNCGAE